MLSALFKLLLNRTSYFSCLKIFITIFVSFLTHNIWCPITTYDKAWMCPKILLQLGLFVFTAIAVHLYVLVLSLSG